MELLEYFKAGFEVIEVQWLSILAALTLIIMFGM